MKLIGLSLSLMLLQTAAKDDPFTSYLKAIREHRVQPAIAAYVHSCGANPPTETPLYGVFGASSWLKSSDLTKVDRANQTEFFSTSEVWVENGRAKVVILWNVESDNGSEVRTVACLGPSGKAAKMLITNWGFPRPMQDASWIHQEYATFDGSGKLLTKSGHFEDAAGHEVEKPKVDDALVGDFEFVTTQGTLAKIEHELLPQHNEKD